MDVALAVILLWILLFAPLGIVVHWMVLGPGARVRALPIAPLTGIACWYIVLAALRVTHVSAAQPSVAVAALIVSVLSALAIWRGHQEWRSRELIGLGCLVLLGLMLLQFSVFGGDASGPLGFGGSAPPTQEVATIQSILSDGSSKLDVVQEAGATIAQRYTGFEQFAAMTSGFGDSNTGVTGRWSAYSLYSTIAGLSGLLVLLPLFAFARARGVRWLGLIVLVPLGMATPQLWLAMAEGGGAVIAAVPFVAAAVFAQLVTRRDRGWWALTVLYCGAIIVTLGPLAILPVVVMSVAWSILRSSTYEHLSVIDKPVAALRSFGLTVAASILTLIAVFSALRASVAPAWLQLHDSVSAALISWPFSWLGTNLAADGPDRNWELAIWIAGPALLAVAVIYALARNERRELAVLVGAIATVLCALLITVVDRNAGIRMVEFAWLAEAPLLAVMALRAVSLSRETAQEQRSAGRWVGTGPTVIVVAFTVLVFASTTVTGSRMRHAPTIQKVSGVTEGKTLIAAGDPWLRFVLDGERATAQAPDPDVMSGVRSQVSDESITYGSYDQLVLTANPVASDPTSRYTESEALDAYGGRLFLDSSIAAGAKAMRMYPDRHDPIETDPAINGEAGGQLIPAKGVPGCGVDTKTPCLPEKPVLGPGCTAADIPFARSDLDTGPTQPDAKPGDAKAGGGQATASRSDAEANGVLVAGVGAALRAQRQSEKQTTKEQAASAEELQRLAAAGFDSLRPQRPALIGVGCFDVPLSSKTKAMRVHLRDIGVIIDATEATVRHGDGGYAVEGAGAAARRSGSERGAEIRYGTTLGGNFDVTVEGQLGAGMQVVAPEGAVTSGNQTGEVIESPGSVVSLKGSIDGFAPVVRNLQLFGGLALRNHNGSQVEVGRVFMRPDELPASCDFPLEIAVPSKRELTYAGPSADTTDRTGDNPGLVVRIARITGSGSTQTAHIVIGSYLTRGGLPHYVLADWTEQFSSEVSLPTCAGEAIDVGGSGDSSSAPKRTATDAQVTDALGVGAATR